MAFFPQNQCKLLFQTKGKQEPSPPPIPTLTSYAHEYTEYMRHILKHQNIHFIRFLKTIAHRFKINFNNTCDFLRKHLQN